MEQASTPCECPAVKEGKHFCPRHNCNKTPHFQTLCQTDMRYFISWENGRGPGQRQEGQAPPSPQKLWPGDLPCIHRGVETRRVVTERCGSCPDKVLTAAVYKCDLHGECTLQADTAVEGKPVERCNNCEQRETQSMVDESRAIEWTIRAKPKKPKIRAGMVRDRQNRPVDHLEGVYAGASVFLCAGGPSMNSTPLELLNQRGVTIAAVNQIGSTHVRPHLWFSCDEPAHFHEAIWRDPAIMKFASTNWWNNEEKAPRTRNGSGDDWVSAGLPIRKFPNVFVYEKCDKWDPDEFLNLPAVTWNTEALTAAGKKSVLLCAIRLLYWLGFRDIYLLGTDFDMQGNQSYAFDNNKGPDGCRQNNKTYRCLEESFWQMRNHFDDHGLRIFNSTVGGKLRVFPRVPLAEAVDRVLTGFPHDPNDVDGLYRHK